MPPLPVLVKILLVFGIVVAAASRKLHLGLAALAGGWAFALWQGLPFGRIALLSLREFLAAENLLLLLLVTLIMVLSGAMRKAGAMEGFARSVKAVARSRNASIILTPVLIGTLPMPGGAAFSAPLVDALDPERRLGSDRLSAANYWFRHSLEVWWPLFPSFILTATLTGFEVSRLVLVNFYMFPTMIFLGWLFLLKLPGRAAPEPRTPDRAAPQPPAAGKAGAGEVIAGFAPLIVILGTYAVLDLAWRTLGASLGLPGPAAALVGRYAPILTGIGAGMAYVAVRNRGRSVWKGSLNYGTLKLAGVVAGIRIFSALLSAGGAAQSAATELASAGIPPLAVAALLPLISGLVTGVGFGYVGLSLPIVLGLFRAGSFGTLPLDPIVALVAAFGFAGMMVSPLHVCMVVSAEHFKATLPQTIRRFAAPLGLFLAAASAYVAVLARIL